MDSARCLTLKYLLTLRWSELDFLKAKSESPSSGESIFIAPELVLNKTEELIDQVDSGKLVPAVQWLNRCDTIYIDDISRLSWVGSEDTS